MPRTEVRTDFDTECLIVTTHISRRELEESKVTLYGQKPQQQFYAGEAISSGQVCVAHPCEPARIYYITTRENEIVFSDSPPDYPKCQHEPPRQAALEVITTPAHIRKWADEAAANGLNVVRDW